MLFLEFIETFLDPILTTTYGGVFLSVLFILLFTIGFGFFNIPKVIILTTVVVFLLMFIAFGWIPLWIVILLTLIFFGLFLINMRGGSNV